MDDSPHGMEVSVLGLGAMGTAIADWLLQQRTSTAVWNRTPSKAQALL
jgi:3-hydroxyisobutyrate dehydrogenase-like beta-hydroxyacid dehydrogenase